MAEIPSGVLARLEDGEIETVNLMEWLAVDMSALARNVAMRMNFGRIRSALEAAAAGMANQGVTARLILAGEAVARAVPDFDHSDFRILATHASDVVRQWACYAVNTADIKRSLADRLALTLPFAADHNMTVREAAWMAFRPHIFGRVQDVVVLLEPISRSPNAYVRRFAIEALRPRSVWGVHIEALKRDPEIALCLLENVRQDAVRYVQQAVGNWLNDASKSRPDWVAETCARWSSEGNPFTNWIIRRGLRTVARQASKTTAGRLLLHHEGDPEG
jgi:3-methyladenine DNA glycosylase AlkC